MYIPKKIREIVKNTKYKISDVGKSGDTVLLFQNKYVLKISSNKERLEKEYNKSLWISNYIDSVKPLYFVSGYKFTYYLRNYIEGKTLIDQEFTSNPDKLTSLIAETISLLRKLDDKSCPFTSSDNKGDKFIHGDLCLPNIIINNNHVVGLIDLENSGLGDEWYDYSWALWSLIRNLKTDKYNNLLLKKLGITYDKNKFNQYIDKELQTTMISYLKECI